MMGRGGRCAHLGHLLLEGESEACASKRKGAAACGDAVQPLDDEWGRHTEGKVPNHMQLWWLCTQTRKQDKTLLFVTPIMHSPLCYS